MTNSKNPNRGHYNPPPTITYGSKGATPPKDEDRKTESVRKGGES